MFCIKFFPKSKFSHKKLIVFSKSFQFDNVLVWNIAHFTRTLLMVTKYRFHWRSPEVILSKNTSLLDVHGFRSPRSWSQYLRKLTYLATRGTFWVTVTYHMNGNGCQRSYHHQVYENHWQAFQQDRWTEPCDRHHVAHQIHQVQNFHSFSCFYK